ncbi:MAG: UDPGP type 1 family protein, partial [Pirellulaceae bacterium]
MTSTTDRIELLKQHGQSRLAKYLETCPPDVAERLGAQIDELDLSELQIVADSHGEAARDLDSIEPPPAFRLGDENSPIDPANALAAGEALLKDGKVAAILVAGGQGTRLGFDHPKGMFPLGPVSGQTLFQIHFEKLIARGRRYGKTIPLYLMTSPATHAETVEFLQENNRFGLEERDLRIFCQGTMPAIDDTDKQLLLAEPDSLALSPDGHGGMLRALVKTGCLAEMQKRGIEEIYYFQVDNPLAEVCEPELLGFHRLSQSEMSTQVVAKQQPEEKLGILALVDGQLGLVEYSELPDELAQQRDDDGNLKHWAGNIAVHAISVEFLAKVAKQADSLPWHQAHKKVPHLDEQGNLVEPEEPNAIKFVRFIFDLLP